MSAYIQKLEDGTEIMLINYNEEEGYDHDSDEPPAGTVLLEIVPNHSYESWNLDCGEIDAIDYDTWEGHKKDSTRIENIRTIISEYLNIPVESFTEELAGIISKYKAEFTEDFGKSKSF